MKNYYDKDGNYVAFKDSEGRYFRSDGEYLGFKDSEGRFFDGKGELVLREIDDRSRDDPHAGRCPYGSGPPMRGPRGRILRQADAGR